MTEKTTEKELEFQSYEISDSFSQTIEEECDQAAHTLVEGNEDLTEEDVKSFGEPFKAAVRSTVKRLLGEEVVPHYEGQMQSLVEEVQENLTEDINDYLEFVVEDFVEQNRDALVASQTAEQDRTIVEGLQTLLQDNFVEVPENRRDLVEDMNNELSEANEQIENLEEEVIALRRQAKGARCEKIFSNLAEELSSDSQKERFLSLVEDLDIDDVNLFEEKATKIRNSLFTSSKKPEDGEELEEEVSETLTEEEGNGSETPPANDIIAQAARIGSLGSRSGFPRR